MAFATIHQGDASFLGASQAWVQPARPVVDLAKMLRGDAPEALPEAEEAEVEGEEWSLGSGEAKWAAGLKKKRSCSSPRGHAEKEKKEGLFGLNSDNAGKRSCGSRDER